jgi:hypothetical protein
MIKPDGINVARNKEQMETVYLPLLMGAAAVWDGSRDNIAALERYDIRATYLVGGYHPAMEEIIHKKNKDIDFLFYGSITPHRREMLRALEQRGCQVCVTFDVRAIYRNDLIARAKVNLSPGQGAGMGQLPWSRICYLLNNGSLCVVERCHDQAWLEHCFLSASTDHWIDLCRDTLHRPDRCQIAEEFAERFRKMPFADRLAEVLESSLSRLPRRPLPAVLARSPS